MKCYVCNKELESFLDDTEIDSRFGIIINGECVCHDCSDSFVAKIINSVTNRLELRDCMYSIYIDKYDNLILRYEIPKSKYDNRDDYVCIFIDTYTAGCTIQRLDYFGKTLGFYEVKNPTKEKVREFINIIQIVR